MPHVNPADRTGVIVPGSLREPPVEPPVAPPAAPPAAPPPPPGGGGVGQTPQQILAALVARWNAGEFPNREAMVAAIQAGLSTAGQPLSESAALEFFNELQTSGSLTQPSVDAAATGDPLGLKIAEPEPFGPSPIGPPPLSSEENQLQGFLLAGQSPEDVFRRITQERFGSSAGGGFVQRALRNPFERFLGTNPITSFGNLNELGQQFGDFLGGPAPTQAGLSEQLRSILAGAGASDQSSAIFEGAFTAPGAETAFGQFAPAFRASIQPTLQGVNPRLRGNVQQILENRFRNRLASDPGLFENAQNVFADFAGRGFFQ